MTNKEKKERKKIYIYVKMMTSLNLKSSRILENYTFFELGRGKLSLGGGKLDLGGGNCPPPAPPK